MRTYSGPNRDFLERVKNDPTWAERRPGETEEEYQDRLPLKDGLAGYLRRNAGPPPPADPEPTK